MATAVPVDPVERENYLNAGLRRSSRGCSPPTISASRCSTSLSITFFFFIGGFFALLIRLELLTPAGDLVQADTYNKLFTMHGMVMVFFFLIPSCPPSSATFSCR